MDTFLKAKRTNQITVSDVFTNRRGFKSIIVHAPVIKNGHFDGTVGLILSFNFIANRYIEDIRIGKDGYAWIVSGNGTELSCPVSGHVGNSVFDNSRAFPDILAMAQRMVKGEQGVATYIDDRIRENVTRKTIIHSVFMPVHLGDNFWSIVVSTPEDEVTGGLNEFRNRLLLIAILLLISIGLFFYMLIKTSIVVKESELRRKSEDALRNMTDRMTLAARAGGVGIWDYDIVNNVLVWDEQMFALYGITQEQFSGAYEAWRAGLHPEDMARGDAEIQLALAGEKDFDTVFRVVWPDGAIRTIRALAIVQRDETGKPLRMIGTNWDITAQKQAEEEITAKNQELENCLYIASHDLRSPLVNIQGFSRRLQKQVDSIETALAECALSPATKAGIDAITRDGIPKTLNFIFSSVTKMDVLLNGLLHLSRTGRAIMTIKEIDINQLFQKIIANFNFQLTQLDATITTKDIPSCYGDENLLNQLFSNIIGNAIKYYDKNRGLVIEVTARKEFRKVIYSIRDTGLGMESRHLERIWDIFYRVDSTLADAGEGLGLSIVKRIAEKHKGRVWVESAAGKGSVFYIELQTSEFKE